MKWSPASSLALLILASGAGCTDVIGLSDLRFDRVEPVAGGGNGGGGGSGAMTGGAGGSGGTGCEAALFLDSFEDGRLETDWDPLVTEPASVVETGGELVLSVGPTGTASLTTDERFELVGGTATIELGLAGEGSSRTAVQLLAAGMRLAIDKSDATLLLQKQVSLVTTDLWQGVYDPIAHRHLRIRDEAEELHFEASEDGIAFTSLEVIPHTQVTPLTDVGIEIELNANGSDTTARFDDLALCP